MNNMTGHPHPHTHAAMNVKRLLLREVLEQHDQTIRPFASTYSVEERNKFDEVTQGGALIDASSLSGIASAILRPNARNAATAIVDNGWSTRRFYFWMEMDIQRSKNSVNTEIISGYTDYLGASTQSASIDPQLRFYVNNHLIVNQVLAVSGTGNGWVPMASANNQVIVPSVLSGASTQRPTDLFTTPLVESSVTELLTRHGAIARPTLVHGEQVKLSRRDNLDPASYLSNVLQSQRQSRITAGFMGEAEDITVLAGAATRTVEHEAGSSPILRNLMQESSFMANGFFTYGELLAMDSTKTLDSRVQVVFNRAETQWDTFANNNTQNWAGGDNTTLIANKLSMQFTKLALDNMCTGFEFSATNATPGGMIAVAMTNMHLFSPDMHPTHWLDRVTAGIEGMLRAECVMMPHSTISLRASVNPFGTTRMYISVDNEPEVPFMFATFSDSMVSAIVNPSMDAVMRLSADIRDISTMTDHNFMTNYDNVQQPHMQNIMGNQVNSLAQPTTNPGWALQAQGNFQRPAPAGISNPSTGPMRLSF